MRQEGFAVYDETTGEVQINTVSETERAAMVNGLYIVNRVPALNTWTDEYIQERWYQENCHTRWRIGIVSIIFVKEAE